MNARDQAYDALVKAVQDAHAAGCTENDIVRSLNAHGGYTKQSEKLEISMRLMALSITGVPWSSLSDNANGNAQRAQQVRVGVLWRVLSTLAHGRAPVPEDEAGPFDERAYVASVAENPGAAGVHAGAGDDPPVPREATEEEKVRAGPAGTQSQRHNNSAHHYY